MDKLLDSFRPFQFNLLIAGLVITVVWLGGSAGVEASMLVTESTSNSVTISWNAPGDDGVNGVATQYDFRYSTSVITEANWSVATRVDNEPTPLPAGTTQTLVIDGLNPNTTYYFAAKSADEVPNWSELSCVVMRSTLNPDVDVTPPMAISDLQAAVAGAPTATPTIAPRLETLKERID